MISRVKLAKFSAKLVANFRRSLEGDFRASFAGKIVRSRFPPKLHRKFHHQTSLRGSGLRHGRALVEVKPPSQHWEQLHVKHLAGEDVQTLWRLGGLLFRNSLTFASLSVAVQRDSRHCSCDTPCSATHFMIYAWPT